MSRRGDLLHIINLIDEGEAQKALAYAKFKDIGARMHEGDTDFPEESKVAEWIMGQIVEIYTNPEQDELFYGMAINAAINIARSFLDYEYWYID